MLKRMLITTLLTSFTVTMAFASQLTLTSDQGGNAGLDNTYTLSQAGKGISKSDDGKLTITAMKRSRAHGNRAGSFVYDGWDKVTMGDKSYNVQFVGMTEKDGTADGVWKAFDTKGKMVDKGTYAYKADTAPTKTGKL